ncbi:hypothetical protein ACHHYP_20007 [Achlya hypogyna]|uniref:Uncharacterized protein n=1 Tax=Achlya hypogyna TaxID=1202772 RepID=A0A1V9ZB83_ACHHY|nr:hypothetical protein ACHHYP_20007 [Achlya hypogyna]
MLLFAAFTTAQLVTDACGAGLITLMSNVLWANRLMELTERAMVAMESLLHFHTIPIGALGRPTAVHFSGLHFALPPDRPRVIHGVEVAFVVAQSLRTRMVALFRLAESDAGTIFIDDIKLPRFRFQC